MNGEFNYKPTWVISSNPRLDALDALEQLYRRLILQVEWYSDQTIVDEPTRTRRVNWIRSWLESDGQEIMREIRSKIQAADDSTREKIRTAIMARQELLDIALDDIRTQEDVEIVWQWIQNSLVSLQLAFRTLPAETVSNEIGNVFLDDQEILYKGTTSDE